MEKGEEGIKTQRKCVYFAWLAAADFNVRTPFCFYFTCLFFTVKTVDFHQSHYI